MSDDLTITVKRQHAILPDALPKLNMPPLLTLIFMPYGIVMRHNTPAGATEKIVSPADIARILSSNTQWETGLLNPNVIYMGEQSGISTTVEYRTPQMTGIWLDDQPEPLRVPMPGLILVRKASPANVNYRVFAVKNRPADTSTKLYVPPLPNTYSNGTICWGNVARPQFADLADNSLTQDWNLLLGSGFNNHSVNGKSRAHKDDIRALLIELESGKKRKYPLGDLLDARASLASVLANKD